MHHLCVGLCERLQLPLELLGERKRTLSVIDITIKEFVVVVIIRCWDSIFCGYDGLC